MIKNLTTIFLILMTMSGYAQDMKAYLKETRSLIKSEKYPEALERCLWFHDHALEKEPAMAGVRLSFALSDWKKLGDVYPPALKAMAEVRDKKTAQVIASTNNSPNLFQDVIALNRTLGVPEKSITLYETILKTNSDLAKRGWFYMKDLLFDSKRYDIIKEFIGNPKSEYNIIVERYARDTALFSRMKIQQAQLKSYAEKSFVEHSLQLIDYSMAMRDKKSAEEIQKKAMGVVNDYRLRDALSDKK